MQKKIAIVVTNQDHYPGKNRPTGLWLSELVHFLDVLEPEGYSYDIVSPKGGKVPLEPKSLHGMAFDRATKKRYENKTFMALLDNSLAAADANPEDYDAIYYTGGHGVMYDFADDENLHRLNRELYESAKIVSAVCHGYCALLNTRLSDGSYLIKDKEITGFTWFEEKLSGVAKIVPYNAEQIAKDRGSKFRKSFIPLRPYVQVDGTLITGQNPFSAILTAQKVLEILNWRST